MMKNNLLSLETIKKIERGEEISPLLFSSWNLSYCNLKVKDLMYDLCLKYDVHKTNIYSLEDNWESIKIEDIRNFISKSNTKASSLFQIFFIENISRLTLASSNSLLKFLEEPWKSNLVFLSNSWENNVLDTILSRVSSIYLAWETKNKFDDYYFSLIDKYVSLWDYELFSYFFREKLEKESYVLLLHTFIYFIFEKNKLFRLLDFILEEINLIEKNNINPKYSVDKLLLKLKEEV